jgi:pyruvate,orthophosphate dikinase
MPGRLNLPAPATEAEAVDPARPLSRAITDAFASYPDNTADAGRQIVIIQPMAEGEPRLFLTRDANTGELGPAASNGAPFGPLPAAARQLCEMLDAAAGQSLLCLVSVEGDVVRLLSARPAAASAAAELEAAVDRVNRGSWTAREAVSQIDPSRLQQLLIPPALAPETSVYRP